MAQFDFKAFAFLIKHYSSTVATHPIHLVYKDIICGGGGRGTRSFPWSFSDFDEASSSNTRIDCDPEGNDDNRYISSIEFTAMLKQSDMAESVDFGVKSITKKQMLDPC